MSENLLPAESWPDGVEQPDVIVNDNARRLEVFALPALSFESTQPGSPAEGDVHVLSAAWGDGAEHDIAYYFDGAWTFWTPFEGQIKDIAGSPYRVESGAWAIYAAGSFAPVAIQFVADLGSTADSDPGAGLLKWNHATQASATQLYLDDLTADGASLTGLWAALSAGGFTYLQHATDPDIWQIWDVTAVVDATGYAKLSVALLAKSTANFADADPMLVTIDQGAPSSSLPDGDYGDIVVSASGATLTIDAGAIGTTKIADDAVTNAKLAHMATLTIKGRVTGSTGDPEDLTAAQAASIVQADGLDADACGFRGIPQNSQSGNYTCVASDAGKEIYHASGAGAGDTYTIPSNGSVAYEIGTAITFTNMDSNALSIAITTDTMYLAGVGTTGTRVLAQYGTATAVKKTATTWLISGVGLT